MKKFSFMIVAIIACTILAAGSTQAAGKKSVSGVVNINTASLAELMMLPGIGKSKAQAIMDYRQAQPFKTAEDLKNVKGIGDKLYASLSNHVIVSGQTTVTVAVDSGKSQNKTGNLTPGGAGKIN